MRFTIRDLLWLTVVAALAVGLYVQRIEVRETRELLDWVEQRKALASYRLDWVDNELSQKGYDLRWDDESGTMGFYYIEPPLPQATRLPHPSDAAH